MEKYIAFGLYQKNDKGGHTAVRELPMSGDEVYVAADVHALLTQVRDEIVASSGLRNEYQDFNDALAAIDEIVRVTIERIESTSKGKEVNHE